MPNAWHKVARLSDVDPDYPLEVKIGKQEFALCKVGDDVFAVDNVCSHVFARLADGEMDGHNIVCPLHSGSFDVRTGEATAEPCVLAIRTFPTRIEGNDILIELDDAPTD